MVSIDGSASKQSGLAGSKSTEEPDGATARKNQIVETEDSSVSLPHPMSANRKRHDNRKPAKGRAEGRLSSFTMPAIALVVGLALIITFSGVLDRPPATASRPAQATGAPPAVAAGGDTAAPMQPVNAGTDLQTLDAAFSESERGAEFLNVGTELFRQGQFEAAATNYEAAVKLLPEDETAHFNYALALARLGRSAEAVTEYKEALRLFPDYAEAHNNLGNLFAGQGRLAEASEHLPGPSCSHRTAPPPRTISARCWSGRAKWRKR
jgi:tetratricopeptide (TPR) repeat protein